MNKLLSAAILTLCAQSAYAVELFNGRDFSGWTLQTTPSAAAGDAYRVLPGGVIASDGAPSGFLATTENYRNYKLHVEWRWSGKPGNGGVLLHISPGTFDRVWPVSLQVQTKNGSAGDLLPMAAAAFAEPLTSAPGAATRIKARVGADSERAVGEWNECDIVSRDGTVEVTVNGVPQNRVTHVTPAAGRIGFQLEGTPYELRNVVLTPLD